MDLVNQLFEDIAQLLANVENIDSYYNSLYENLSKLFGNVSHTIVQLDKVLDKIDSIQYMNIGLIFLVIILLINLSSQHTKVKLLISKMEDLEAKIDEGSIPRVKRHGGERS